MKAGQHLYGLIIGANKARLITLLIIACAVTLGLLVVVARSAFSDFCCIKGWEPYWVAESLMNGHGYSFPPERRAWLDPEPKSGYSSVTAWVDPLYTFMLFVGMWVFGDNHKVLMALFNVLCLGGTLILLAYAARRYCGAWGGVLAVAMLALNFNYRAIGHLASSSFQMLCIMLSAVLVLSYIQTPTVRRAIVLGIVMGLTALACPAALYFLPATALLLMMNVAIGILPRIKGAALLMLFGMLVVTPWTIRNYYVFDEFVTVRNGGGQIAFIGVNLLGDTLVKPAASKTIPPLWTLDSASDAVAKAQTIQFMRQLEDHQLNYARQVGGEAYAAMNEAERDKWFMDKVKEFIKTYPVIFVQLGIAKIVAFIKLFNTLGIVVILAAVAGALLSFAQPAIRILTVWCVLYSAVFVLAVPYFLRYRAPIEPLFCFLAAIGLVKCSRLLANHSPRIRRLGTYFTE
jgi:hypothetical protein